jgi:DNA-binding winged helix-turn-helix (wHTH) protein
MLLRNGREQPLIPRYFDLLVFLIERRGEAVHRRDIFDRVWGDVVVSDSALSQAVRTIRRVLGDESREPRFLRTVPRHGYRFVFADVVEEDDESEWQIEEAAAPVPAAAANAETDPYEPLLQRVASVATNRADEEDQREAAELRSGHPRPCGGWEPARTTPLRARCCAIRDGMSPRRATCRFSASRRPWRRPGSS